MSEKKKQNEVAVICVNDATEEELNDFMNGAKKAFMERYGIKE